MTPLYRELCPMHNPFAKHHNLIGGQMLESRPIPGKEQIVVTPIPKTFAAPPVPGLGSAIVPAAEKPKKKPAKYLPGERLLQKAAKLEKKAPRPPPPPESSDEDEPMGNDGFNVDDVRNIAGAISNIMVKLRLGDR